MSTAKDAVLRVFEDAGIAVGGSAVWDIKVHDERFYRRLLSDGSLGLGESYVEGWWDAERVDLFVEHLLRVRENEHASFRLVLLTLKARLFNLQSKRRSKDVVDAHYDLDNELYFSFLDPYNQYTCGYFKGTDDLAVAQKRKLDLVCRKLELKEGERVLDIGCGWGGFARYAAENYGCSVVGVTISKEQAAYAEGFVSGLPVEIQMRDYRDLGGERFDKIASIGMLEHVGYKNYRTFMRIVSSALKDDGLFLLHVIGRNDTAFTGELWADRYIFPNGMLPSIKQLGAATERLLVMEDWHNFGPYYHRTLRAWDTNFQRNWPRIKHKHPERYYRMFRYYFNGFAGAFKARRVQLWQIVFSKGRSDRPYEAVR